MLHFLRDAIRFVLLYIGYDDVRTFLGEPESERPSDSLTCAGDYGD
jgi:hypothetical protein